MAKKILTNYDFNKNEIQNAVAQVLATAPSTPVAGQFYYDSALQLFRYRNGTTFVSDTDRARHSGTQLASTISDFNTAVQTNRLDQLAAPTAAVSLNSQRITNVATPTAATDAANKSYVDNAIAGLSWKDEVRVATTANGTLASAFANGQVVDGVTLVTGDRILLKNQTTATENGIYTVNASGAPTRATDADTGAELIGAAVYVTEGTANNGTRWVNSNTTSITLGSTNVTFVSFGGGSAYTAGNGLTLTANDFNVGAGTGIVVGADTVSIDTAVVARKSTGLIGNGSLTSITYNHALANQWVTVQVIEVATLAVVDCDVVLTDANNVTLTFSVAPTSNALRVIVTG